MRAPLTIALTLFWIAYQTANFCGGFPGLSKEWFASTLEVHWWGKAWEWPAFRGYFTERPHAMDSAANAIAGVGYVARFGAGQTPEFVGREIHQGHLQLYLRDETLLASPDAPSILQKHLLRPLGQFLAAMGAHGIEVVVVPVPPKRFVQGDRRLAAVFTEVISSFPSQVVNVMPFFDRAKGEALFVPHASHWTSRGMTLAAEAVAHHLQSRGWKLPVARSRPVHEKRDVGRRDLLDAFQLPVWFLGWAGDLQWTETIYEVEAAPATPKRAIVAGSCFSTRFQEDNEGFPENVGRAVGRGILNTSVADPTPFLALQKMHTQQWMLSPGDLLVVEFPVRLPDRPLTIPTLLVEDAP